MTDGSFPVGCVRFRVLVLFTPAHCRYILGHLNRTESLLMLAVNHVRLWHVKMSAGRRPHRSHGGLKRPKFSAHQLVSANWSLANSFRFCTIKKRNLLLQTGGVYCLVSQTAPVLYFRWHAVQTWEIRWVFEARHWHHIKLSHRDMR